MKIQENIPLAQYTTFKIGGPAKFFCAVSDENELVQAVKYAKAGKIPMFILGGGSNLLISDKGYDGLVIKIELAGVSFSGDKVTAAAGESWDRLVEETVKRGLYGLENLSAIPGTVGATAVQNIGAYGADISRTIEFVRALDTKKLEFRDISNAECKFGYRDSLFKQQRGRYIISTVTFQLENQGNVDISYKDLVEYFSSQDKKVSPDSTPTLAEVRQAVVKIRSGKLPDWRLWGTAGSFFKNPIVRTEIFTEFKKKYPAMPGFPEGDGLVKIPLGWILDKVCNIKGMEFGNAKVFENQALVIVAKPGATAEEVLVLTSRIRDLVWKKTGLEIEAEVEWVN